MKKLFLINEKQSNLQIRKIKTRCSFAIRDDDVCYFTQPEDLEAVFSKLWDRIPISLSVVPFHACTKSGSLPKEYWRGEKVFPLGENKPLIAYLREKISEGKITISLHGYSHKEENGLHEFQAKEGLYEKILRGKKYLEDLLGVEIKTFVPPQNTISREGLEAVKKVGLNLSCVPSFRPGYRALRLGNLFAFIKLKYYGLRYRRLYPRVLNLDDHKELYFHKLEQVRDFEKLKDEFDFCYKRKGQFCLNTHYWQLKDNPQMLEALIKLVRFLDTVEDVELTDLDDLFLTDSLRCEVRYKKVACTPTMKILYLTYGPQSFVIEHLSRSLAKKRIQVDVFNAAQELRYKHPRFRIPSVRPSNLLNVFLALVQFGPNWNIYFHKTAFAFRLMTANCQKKLAKDGSYYDFILQSGAMFAPSFEPTLRPYALYIDHTHALTKRYPDVEGLPTPPRVSPQWEAREENVYQGAAYIFPMSNIVKRSLIKDYGVGKEKIVVVGAGPNVKIPPPNRSGSDKDKTILFVGKDFAAKGGQTLLEAFDLVRKEVKGAKLVVVGAKYPDIKKQGVEFRGGVSSENMGRIYKEATIFVLPTFREAFGISFLEAMAHKLPCIGSKIEAIPEIIEDGRTGYIVAAGDHLKLAKRIVSLLNDKDLIRKMGEKGYRKVVGFYNWDLVAEQILKHVKERISS